MILRLRWILFCSVWLGCAASAFSAGEYQQTKDGKTLVWNWTPREGETATWSGSRDADKYASGFGELTWYSAQEGVDGLYYGNMVHGKFEGPVNIHIRGRTAHAYFVDGGRVTAWSRGPAPSNMKVPEALVMERRKAEAEKPAATEPRTALGEKPKPAAPERSPKEKPEAKKAAQTEPVVSESTPAEAPSRAPPVIAKKKNGAASSIRAFREPTPISKPTPAKEIAEATQVPTPQPSPPQETNLEQAPPEARPTPNEAAASEATEPFKSPPESSKAKTDADISLNALVGPPSSLRSTSETPPATSENEPPVRESGALSEAEAIKLADTEARIHGYQLENYERPRVDHSDVKGKWSLFYALKEPATSSESAGPFSVTVEDKTKKVEFRK